jgi:hypothetical protein
MQDLKKELRAAMFVGAMVMAAAFAGCGDDDDDGPSIRARRPSSN